MSKGLPKLRFPGFEGEWSEVPLHTFARLLNERVRDGHCVPYTVTAGVGLISQSEKYGRSIAGNSLRNYTRLQKDDFAYNKSATKAFPEGYIARFHDEVDAAVPNSIFTCFAVDQAQINCTYLEYLFGNNLHGTYLRKFLSVGARSHGSLNVNDSDLMQLPVPVPPDQELQLEQLKIAECLTSLDKLIAAENQKLEKLHNHKKFLLQNLFPSEGETTPRLRFPEFEERGGWEQITLKKLCDLKAGSFVPASAIATHPAADAHPCYGGNGLRGFVRSYTHEGVYPLVGRQGAHCGNVHLVSGKFHATEHAIVATPRGSTGVWWLYYALDNLNLNRFATGQAQPGLSVSSLNTVELTAPRESEEQHRIAQCLRYLDSLVSEQSKRLEAFKSHKKSLMQGLFPTINSCD